MSLAKKFKALACVLFVVLLPSCATLNGDENSDEELQTSQLESLLDELPPEDVGDSAVASKERPVRKRPRARAK